MNRFIANPCFLKDKVILEDCFLKYKVKLNIILYIKLLDCAKICHYKQQLEFVSLKEAMNIQILLILLYLSYI